MLSGKLKIQSFFLFISHFLNFAGYYAFLAILSNLGLIAFSRGLTIPLRVLILACLCCIILLSKQIYVRRGARLFVIFSAVYIARIIFEMARMKSYHLDATEFLLYFLAFGALPLLIISSLKLTYREYNIIKWSILVSGLILSLVTLIYYRSLIGTVGRLSSAVARDENYISPLSLSYCGTLSIGIGISYLMEYKDTLKNRFLMLILILFALVPFYLGASRGSVFALFVPFIVSFFAKRSSAASIRTLLIIGFIGAAGVYLAQLFGSDVVNRFTNIGSDISKSNESAIRLAMWKAGLTQFLDNPIFGNSLEVDTFKVYPHNIFVEVLLSTGIIGFIPFMAMIIDAFRKVLFIFRNDPRNSWLGIVFIQSLIQHMFSGSLYGASWLWVSLGLLYSYEYVQLRRSSPVNFN